MPNFYVGQKVARYRDGKLKELQWHLPPIGEPVTVSYVGTWHGDPVINLVEYPDNVGYYVGVFRPLTERKTDISIFRKALDPNNIEFSKRILEEV